MTVNMVRDELKRGSENGQLKKGDSRPCDVINCTNKATKWVSIHPFIQMRRYYCEDCERKANVR